jgi:hypothetical protein
MDRAVDWLSVNELPAGMAMRMPRRAAIRVLAPVRW